MTRPALTHWMLLAATVVGCATPSRQVREGPPPRTDAEAPPSSPASANPETAPSGASPSAPSAAGADRAPVPPKGAAPEREVRAAVNALASAGLGEARPARFFEALSRALELLPGASLAEGELDRLRDETGRLRDLDPIDLDRADRVKAGFDRALAAFTSIANATLDEQHDGFLEEAAQAVRRLDDRTPLGLQRTELQDAARALADAVLVALQFGKPCPGSGPPP